MSFWQSKSYRRARFVPGYFLSALFCGFFCFFIVSFSVSISQAKSFQWLNNWVMGEFYSICFLQPLLSMLACFVFERYQQQIQSSHALRITLEHLVKVDDGNMGAIFFLLGCSPSSTKPALLQTEKGHKVNPSDVEPTKQTQQSNSDTEIANEIPTPEPQPQQTTDPTTMDLTPIVPAPQQRSRPRKNPSAKRRPESAGAASTPLASSDPLQKRSGSRKVRSSRPSSIVSANSSSSEGRTGVKRPAPVSDVSLTSSQPPSSTRDAKSRRYVQKRKERQENLNGGS
eukprot:GILI01052797.1.p1 GENE.GILI01052797.1~~GILI01052797.1.p1  ORF type:complete len:309 (+),score=55.28 GILI01052797.1:73-927(+)